MSDWGFLAIAKYIEALDIRDCYPVIESPTQKYPDRQISPETAIRTPSLPEDQAEESISRLDCDKPCTGFAEYCLDFFEKTASCRLKTHGKEKFKGELP